MDPKETAQIKVQLFRRTLIGTRLNAPLGSRMHLHTPRTNDPQKRAALMLTSVRNLANIYHGRLWICILNGEPVVCSRSEKNMLMLQRPDLQVTEVKPSYEVQA